MSDGCAANDRSLTPDREVEASRSVDPGWPAIAPTSDETTSTGSTGDVVLGQTWLQRLRQQRAIVLVRSDSFELGDRLARLAISAGLTMIEIAWTDARAAQTIANLRRDFPQCEIGAGTILSAAEAKAAIDAGAQFLFSPHTDLATLAAARSASIPCVPGALTPTEIHQAHTAGATAIKLFPIAPVGGVEYLRALRAPLPHLAFIPTGGISTTAAARYLEAGAIAVALSSALFPADLVRQQAWGAIEAHIQSFVTQLGPAMPIDDRGFGVHET
ncbi:MAG: bifunctional 4-hydroxy-2-oxoglutarate aldolase/2-dehydro-3-deoxy-phosphogluconate aldolase, partial [Oscillatoriales cyanobacterium]